MEPPVEINELMERIRRAVNAQRRAEGQPDDPSPRLIPVAISGPLPIPAAPDLPPRDEPGREALEAALAEAASMLPRARQKTDVSAGVPKILRPLYRNQGGFNGILLEASGRLLEANRLLELQNSQLRERLGALEAAVARQHDWAVAVAMAHDEQREWMTGHRI